jgi:hypothetical protein
LFRAQRFEKKKNLLRSFRSDCAGGYKGTNIPHLKSILMQVSLGARLALEPVPRYYADLWEALRDASVESPFCSFKEYREIAQSVGVPMDGAFNVVTRFLHDVGRLIYFGSADSQQVSDVVVLDPAWLAARMTDIISFKQNWAGGVVDRGRLQIIWKQYDQKRQDEILSLLERFQVVFMTRVRTVGENTLQIVVPSLLPESIDLGLISRGLVPASNLTLCRRVYQFNWIPLGFAARLISLFHGKSQFKILERWRFGVVLATTSGTSERGIIGNRLMALFDIVFDPRGKKKQSASSSTS